MDRNPYGVQITNVTGINLYKQYTLHDYGHSYGFKGIYRYQRQRALPNDCA